MDARLTCVIATTPRSGSWLLSDALYSTGLVGPPEEYFRPEVLWVYEKEWDLKEPTIQEYVDKAIEVGTSANGVFGMKLHTYQWKWLSDQLLQQYPKYEKDKPAKLFARFFPDPHYIFLKRRDTARQAISHYRAIETGIWNIRTDEHRPRLPVDHEPDFGLVKWSERALTTNAEEWAEFFLANDVPLLEITYEDFVDEYTDTIVEALRFLGLKPPKEIKNQQTNLQRQSDDISERWLEEYLRVRDTVKVKKREPFAHISPRMRRKAAPAIAEWIERSGRG